MLHGLSIFHGLPFYMHVCIGQICFCRSYAIATKVKNENSGKQSEKKKVIRLGFITHVTSPVLFFFTDCPSSPMKFVLLDFPCRSQCCITGPLIRRPDVQSSWVRYDFR